MFPFLDFQMHNSYFSVRNFATVALLLFGSMAVARAAAPTPHGTVISVNQSAHTFTVQWMGAYERKRGMGTGSTSHERILKTTDKTAGVCITLTGCAVHACCDCQGSKVPTCQTCTSGSLHENALPPYSLASRSITILAPAILALA